MNILLIVLAVFGVVFIGSILIYNSLVAKKNQVSNVLAGVDTQLKKRYDLIPNLVASVKEYLTHEREVLTKITELRSQAMNTTNQAQKFDLNNQLASLLGNLKVAIENYPDLKANQNVLHLQGSLLEVEEQISASRRAYNGAVMEYNNACEMFPTNIIANMFNFAKSEFFKTDENEKNAPSVKDLFK